MNGVETECCQWRASRPMTSTANSAKSWKLTWPVAWAARWVVAGDDVIEKKFKPQGILVEFLKIYNEPDGTLYSGILNPFLPESVMEWRRRIVAHSADMGITWDSDFDCRFLFDEHGDFSGVATPLACRLKHF